MSRALKALLRISVLCFLGVPAFGQNGPSYPTVTKKAAALTNAPVRQISSNLFRIGQVTINTTTRALQFPSTVNMNSDLIEFVCDGGDTKLHESLFRTDASPLHIHLGALLLSKPGSNSTNGIPVSITVSRGSGTEEVPLEKFILKADPKTKKQSAMPGGNWVYSGWNAYQGRMPSEISGVVIALLGDSTALINCRDPDHDDDQLWYINPRVTPPVGVPVEISIHFKKS
jgi:hypothetical protein